MKKKPQKKSPRPRTSAPSPGKSTSATRSAGRNKASTASTASTLKRQSAFLELDTQVKALAVQMDKAQEVAFDTETTGLNWKKDVMVGMSVTDDIDAGFFFMPNKNTAAAVSAMVTRPSGTLVGHNVKFDLHFLDRFGIKVRAKYIHCTKVLARMLDENRFPRKGVKEFPYGLKPLARDWYDAKATETSDALQEWMAKNNKTWANIKEVPKQLLAKYGAEDARITLALYRVIRKRLAEDGIPDATIEREARINKIAFDMETRGIAINIPFLKKYKVQLEKERAVLSKKLQRIAGRPFNPDSADQLTGVLVKLGWKPAEEDASAKTGKDSVDEKAISKFKHPITPLVLEYRSLGKVLGTFVNGMLERQVKGVIHCDFDTSGARTGRWSSKDPNLQNQPEAARYGFVPRKGFDLWSFDFKQIEPTLLAHFSDDYDLKQIFVTGGDFHSLNASAAFNVPLDKVTKEQRDIAKALGLAIMYGAGAAKAAEMMGVPVQQAAQLLNNYNNRFPAVKKLTRKVQEEIEETAREAAIKAGTLTAVDGPNGMTWYYKTGPKKTDRIELPQYKYVPKAGSGAKAIPLGKHPENFRHDDKWNDPSYWQFPDWSAIKERGFIQNPFGYKRHLSVSEAYKGLNSKIQGTAAALIKEAMIRVEDFLAGRGFQLLQVHDELVLELPKGPAGKALAKGVKAAMESLGEDYIKDVPIRVDVAMSPKSWGDMKEVKL